MFKSILIICLNFIAVSVCACEVLQESVIPYNEINIIRRHYGQVDSTQDLIMQHMKDVKEKQWFMVSAESQQRGRGMYGRSWVSPQGNVFVTYGVYVPKENLACVNHLSQLAAVAVCDTLEDEGFQPEIRWPNNVLINGQKISGALCQNTGFNGKSPFKAIIGIGINVDMTTETAQSITGQGAGVTSLHLLGKILSRDDVLLKLTSKVFTRFSTMQGVACGFEKYKRLLAYQGQIVSFRDFDLLEINENNEKKVTYKEQEHKRGKFIGVNQHGHMIMEGQAEALLTGEIVPGSASSQ